MNASTIGPGPGEQRVPQIPAALVDIVCAVHGPVGHGCRHDHRERGYPHAAAGAGCIVVRASMDHRLLYLGPCRVVADDGVVGRPFRKETGHADRPDHSGLVQRVSRLLHQHRTADRSPDNHGARRRYDHAPNAFDHRGCVPPRRTRQSHRHLGRHRRHQRAIGPAGGRGVTGQFLVGFRVLVQRADNRASGYRRRIPDP